MSNNIFPMTDHLRLQYYKNVMDSVDEDSLLYDVYQRLYERLKKTLAKQSS